ncbi:LON peptidase substrate-binding domain-containing protein [Ferribacterium limneticum]|uniref:LON peptidase substrate-binding domain-containing protein n=1 Tax=Ferribacterium limneticum TaxID=76259 RepID=UPI001CF94917|nr:LON peptidase substrate-binding domain-containing protein [Ferribacterium limneticum]UCV28619.1 LON peptidase substrate-binding domain-containing protein [Ferribacterium limneticum]UCV32536.1 LON peptidase substrate-binding domain-containing protein [Ferribacterium limneticum]
MGWFDFIRSPSGNAVETLRIPLFPLSTVLFPGSMLPLKIFEQRYLDMAAACMKDNMPFGVCLIEKGSEVGETAVPHSIGTLATISTWEMEQLGILMITAQGGRRFRIIESTVGPGNQLEANVELLAETGPTPLPPERERLVPLLRRIVGDLGKDRMPEPHRYDEAEWVGYRITEVLPIQNLAKQKLLELDDPVARLEILEKYLTQRKLLG